MNNKEMCLYIGQKIRAMGESIKRNNYDYNVIGFTEDYCRGIILIEQAEFYLDGVNNRIPIKWGNYSQMFLAEYKLLIEKNQDNEYQEFIRLRKKYHGY